ncbi:MAG: gluconate 2-dehydrogenase subunit 3 family protein, partial [Chloroflexi bacterium]|nr:gluconate 2-dehydrogenase subunit 3 family protein [Chloroflexota bacterium]
ERFMRGLAHLDEHSESMTGVRFAYAGEERQTAILKGMEAEGRALMDADLDAPESFFHQARGLVLHGYYTSEIGMKEEMLFVGIPGRYDGYTPLSEISRAGGTSNE